MLRHPLLISICTLGLIVSGCSKSSDTASTEGPSSAGSTSGGAPTASGKKLVIGFSQIGAESAWRTAETKSVQDEAAKRGIDLKFSDAQGKQENQIKALHSFVDQGVDAIIMAPGVETGWEPALREIKKAKIPVILVDRGVKVDDDSLYTTLICSDFVEEGRRAAEAVVKAVNGKGNVVQLLGSPGAAPAIDRQTGFEEVIAKHPDIKIIKSQTGDFKRSNGKEVMEAFLKSPEGGAINAVYAHNDDMALGAIQAIEAAGKKPGTDILVFSIDGIHDGMEALADGKENAIVECNPLLGPNAFDAVNDALSGKTLDKKTIQKDAIFDQASAKSALPDRKY